MGGRSGGNSGNYNGAYGNYGNQSFEQLLRNYVGQTVIVFTTSGGPSGCGFEGIVLEVNSKFIRLSNQMGNPPASPLSETICGDLLGDLDGGCASRARNGVGASPGSRMDKHPYPVFTVGSVCDIPIDKIAAFCHNAL
jgi:hypothetical protein